MGIKTVRLADKLAAFEQMHGHKVEIALQALAEDQASAARTVSIPEAAQALAESSESYSQALAAWRELADAIDGM